MNDTPISPLLVFHTLDGEELRVSSMPIRPNHRDASLRKGFTNEGVVGRQQFALKCLVCGTINRVARFVLMNNQPQCQGCLHVARLEDARRAGLQFLRRDECDRKYAFYKAACGHELRRQFGRVKKVGAPDDEVRCGICQRIDEDTEAAALGWHIVSADPDGNPNYRLYGHDCGHQQRVARANMQTGRFQCESCGVGCASLPSWIYLYQINFPTLGRVIKAGHSRLPKWRLRNQLGLHKDVRREVLRATPIATGSQARRLEDRIHSAVKKNFPAAVVPKELLVGLTNLKSEVYLPQAEFYINQLFDALEAELSPQKARQDKLSEIQEKAQNAIRHGCQDV